MAAVLALVLIALYLVPAIVAAIRNAQHGDAIVLLNLLAGWTLIGWVGALILALVDSAEVGRLSPPIGPRILTHDGRRGAAHG